MASYSQTIAQIQDTITVLFRNMTGKSNPTYLERTIIQNSCNEAMQQLVTERGVEAWHFLRTRINVTTAAAQAYVDIDEDVVKIVTGSVTIPDEQYNLGLSSLEWIRSIDPEAEDDGIPAIYALISSGDPDVTRLQLYPIPDAAYVIYMDVEKLVSADGNTEFPTWYTGPITDLATSIMMRRLGFGNPMLYYDAYMNSLYNIVDNLNGDGPIGVQKSHQGYRSDLQRRAE